MLQRINNRLYNELRNFRIIPNYYAYNEGSCLIEMGNTKIICAATVEEKVPLFLKGSGSGWITAEYSMLPKSSATRIEREATKGKQSGRTLEIQRLIGRGLRACVDLQKLGERLIKIDCDVLQADGGTRTASITGGYIALVLTINNLLKQGIIKQNPLTHEIAAISCGVVEGNVLLDLDYSEDSKADIDANFIITSDSKIVELQISAEKEPLVEQHLTEMLVLAKKGIKEIIEKNQQILNIV